MNILKEEKKTGVYTITLDRPERKNALSVELLGALRQALQNAGKEGSQIVVIRGSGNVFSAGGDLGEFRRLISEDKSLDEGCRILNDCVMLIRNLDAVTIAVLQGVVMGAAIGLSLACDLSVATKGAVMNTAYGSVGLAPDGGGSILLPRVVGMKKANELYFLGRNVGMEEARELGLVNFVWAEEDLEANLLQLISHLMAFPAETIRPFKSLVNDAVLAGLQNHLEKECTFLSELGRSPGFKDRIERFFVQKKE